VRVDPLVVEAYIGTAAKPAAAAEPTEPAGPQETA
jgi:hypothetical protein